MISRIINSCRSSSVVRHTSQLILKSSLLTITNHNKHLLHFQQPLSGISKIITRHNTTSTSASLPNSIDKELLLQFTCNICNNRSSHNISKQAYDYGTVVVQCPSCKSRHLISDNLGFMEYNKKFNLADYLKQHHGQSIETDPNNTVLQFNDIPESLKQKLKATTEDGDSSTIEELDLPEPKDKK